MVVFVLIGKYGNLFIYGIPLKRGDDNKIVLESLKSLTKNTLFSAHSLIETFFKLTV